MGKLNEFVARADEVCSTCVLQRGCSHCIIKIRHQDYIVNVSGQKKKILSAEFPHECPSNDCAGRDRSGSVQVLFKRAFIKVAAIVLLALLFTSNAEARNISTIIVHHTGETNYDLSAEQITRYHTEDRGWNDIGYHYVIRRNGNIELGRAVEKQGAHAKGRNKSSVGIALSGNTATQAQLESLELLCMGLSTEYNILKIERHHEQCPGASVDIKALRNAIIASRS